MAPPSSSESWSAELFPKSHPRHNNKAGGNGGGGASISGASMSHPHIRELVERQQQIKQLQRQLDTTTINTNTQQHHQGGNVKELYYSGKSKNVIQGLHMNHILNTNDNNSLEDGTSLLQSVNSQSQYNHHHPLSPHLNHSGLPHSSANSIHRNNIHRNTQHTHNNMNNTGYEIEGTFQSKGCIPQTADDVGYLFGCGTHPHDEVVYVYNTVPTNPTQGPQTAVADERNLFYHTGPTNTTNGVGDNVNDVLFQIDKEYQQLQSNHVENMREPPPRYPPGHYKMQQHQQHEGGMREQDDDEYTKRSGCSISSIMDLLLPNLRMNHKSRSSTMRDSNSGYYGDYPTDNWRTLCTSPTKRKRRSKHHSNKHTNLFNVVSTSSSEDSTFERTKRRAKDSVYELQQQLKAMVHDRAKAKVGTPTKKQQEESRQESSTPPVSPKPIATTEDKKQKDIDQLRQDQATLDQARKLLQVELAQHQVQLATLNSANPYYNGSFGMNAQPMGGMISPLSAPNASGVGCTSGGGMMSPSPMMMNTGGGMLQPQLSTGMWPQQQQQGMMGGMHQTGLNMMQNTQVGGVVPQQVPSNVSELSKSIFTGSPGQQQGTTQGGKFIDNVGALNMSRSYSIHPTTRTTQSKKKLSPPHPTQRSYSNHEFTSQSNQRLNDLKSKNESIRKDISRMKECMNTSPPRRKGGRPFPRTSPPSSPTRQDRDDAIARAMQRSDEARSLLSGSSGGSLPGGYRSSPNRYNRGSSRRQPPSPIRTSSRGNQEYYHV